jgi:hypothetical protein
LASPAVRKGSLAAALAATAAILAGCGGGASAGATVSVYVGSSLCPAARRALAASGGKAGDLRVRLACLAPAASGGRIDLARAGANARRATEDSASVAFLEAPGPATRFSRTIVEAAGIAWVEGASGGGEMRRVIAAIGEAGTGGVRDSVRESLD